MLLLCISSRAAAAVTQEARNVRLYSVLPSPLVSKLKEVCTLAVGLYCLFPLDLTFATTQACFCTDVHYVFLQNFLTYLRFKWREDVKNLY